MLTKKKPAHRLAFILDTFRYMEETQLQILNNALNKAVQALLATLLYNCAVCIILLLDWLDQVFTLDTQPHGNRCCHED
ncbi:hypothetical protein DFR42_103129 [Undibacterium pigrum]|uniref:Uncharacterized protein n=1 Tax=Undibacterium pigrum TaxID=401470 RepID=A0A318J7J6_9BURK|nr:hypothetical protein DFR42_103129 [Undibacterium pigrum]